MSKVFRERNCEETSICWGKNSINTRTHTRTHTHTHTHTHIYIYIYILYIYIYIYGNLLMAVFSPHPTKQQLYGHRPSISKITQIRRTRYAGHCWRSKDELIRDVLLWTSSTLTSKCWRPDRTYLQQLSTNTECILEDQPEAMDDRDEWRERIREIRAGRMTWWWWWWYK